MIAFCFFAFGTIKYAFNNQKKYEIIFATSSRLGTGVLGFLLSKITNRPLYLDVRDIFSDNIQSLPFFQKTFGKIFVKIFRKIESSIINHASWVNYVSKGFISYPHIKKLDKEFHLFTNGIDDIFMNNVISLRNSHPNKEIKLPMKILYAGNIGFGQGLELIVLPLAVHYKNKILFQLIGDGTSVNLIKKGIIDNNLSNIELIQPLERSNLLKYYNDADIFLLQLNDIPAFNKVLPSKLFDYGSFDKPILAGVKGVAHSFIAENLSNAYLFDPGDYNSVIPKLNNIIAYGIPSIDNSSFRKKFSRKNIIESMINSIISNYYKTKV